MPITQRQPGQYSIVYSNARTSVFQKATKGGRISFLVQLYSKNNALYYNKKLLF
jgi:hypothetical protein